MTVDEFPIFPGCGDMANYSERRECADKKLLVVCQVKIFG